MTESEKKYKEIINLPHYKSPKRSQLSIEARSAQFAPFAALTGYKEEVKETERVTYDKVFLDDSEKEILDNKLNIIKQNIKKNYPITFTYFIKDEKKDGGYYKTITNVVKKIDEVKKIIYLKNGFQLSISEIINIESNYLQ